MERELYFDTIRLNNSILLQVRSGCSTIWRIGTPIWEIRTWTCTTASTRTTARRSSTFTTRSSRTTSRSMTSWANRDLSAGSRRRPWVDRPTAARRHRATIRGPAGRRTRTRNWAKRKDAAAPLCSFEFLRLPRVFKQNELSDRLGRGEGGWNPLAAACSWTVPLRFKIERAAVYSLFPSRRDLRQRTQWRASRRVRYRECAMSYHRKMHPYLISKIRAASYITRKYAARYKYT